MANVGACLHVPTISPIALWRAMWWEDHAYQPRRCQSFWPSGEVNSPRKMLIREPSRRPKPGSMSRLHSAAPPRRSHLAEIEIRYTVWYRASLRVGRQPTLVRTGSVLVVDPGFGCIQSCCFRFVTGGIRTRNHTVHCYLVTS